MEVERVLVPGCTVVLGPLWRQRHQARAQFLKLAQNALQSIQLCIAVGSPDTAEDGRHHRPAGQQVGRAHDVALRVREREIGQPVADPQGPIHDAAVAQVLGCGVHDRPRLRGYALGPTGAYSVELFS